MRAVRSIVLAALLALPGSGGHAQAPGRPDPTVGTYLPGCRAVLADTDSSGLEAAGPCSGAVDALLYVGELLPADWRSCVPLRTSRRDIIAAIVEDIEALRPEVERHDFKGMVLAILSYRWPCRE